jgi:hypothetical protein
MDRREVIFLATAWVPPDSMAAACCGIELESKERCPMMRPSSSAGNVSCPAKQLGGNVSSDAKSTLELARIFSIEAESNFVLCKNFLPGIDIAVSAAGEEFWGEAYSTSRDSMEKRCREVISVVENAREKRALNSEWGRVLMSFGLVYWWPISVRQRVENSLGPFNVVIHRAKSNRLMVQFSGDVVGSSAMN